MGWRSAQQWNHNANTPRNRAAAPDTRVHPPLASARQPMRRRSPIVSLKLLLFTATLLITLLAGCSLPTTTSATSAPPPSAVGADNALKALTPPPTPTTDPIAAQNAAMGCSPNAPAPQPHLLYTGFRPGASGSPPKEVALTFDDGPTPDTSPPILKVLEDTHTPATFFVEGQYIKQWPDLLRREWNDGFAIALHTWDHPLMSQQSDAGLKHQFNDTLTQMRAILGPNVCIWIWRPPYADYNQHVLTVAASYGLTTITWDDSSDDWDRPGVSKIVSNVLSAIHPGAVVLMHDGPAAREQTAAALPLIIDGLKARGLTPVTLPRLLADGQYPGIGPGTPTATTTPTATP